MRAKKFILMMAMAMMVSLLLNYGLVNTEYLLPGIGFLEDQEWIDPVSMISWVLLFTPVWGYTLIGVDKAINSSTISLYRHIDLKHWWFALLYETFESLFIIYMTIGSVTILIFHHEPERWLLFSFLLVSVHGLFLSALGIWLRLCFNSMIPVVMILIIGEVLGKVSVVAGIIKPSFNPFAWGMFNYSSLQYSNGGFNIFPVICLECIIYLGLAVMIMPKLKKILLERICHE